VTFKNPQSESLLRGKRVLHVPYVGSRDAWPAARAFWQIMKSINWREENFVSAVSTGAAAGIVGLLAARLHGVPGFYFETVARVQGPTLSGKIASLTPGIRTYCQYESWANARWKYRPSLLEDYARAPRARSSTPLRLFVTLGTNKSYRFDALIDAVLASGLANENTIWQVGETLRDGLPGAVFTQLSFEEFEKYSREADVVITHAGVGTLMSLFDMGVFPVVVPRRATRNEAVDDHQLQIAELLKRRGIALVAEPDQISAGLISEAAESGVESTLPDN